MTRVLVQASNVPEARELYDQLTPLCPIMLALTARGLPTRTIRATHALAVYATWL